MKQVRILKDNYFEGVNAYKGEIWNFDSFFKDNKVANIFKDGKTTRVCLTNDNKYGLEAEFVNESEEINIQLW